jgi:hypothetical protein
MQTRDASDIEAGVSGGAVASNSPSWDNLCRFHRFRRDRELGAILVQPSQLQEQQQAIAAVLVRAVGLQF